MAIRRSQRALAGFGEPVTGAKDARAATSSGVRFCG
jgi:hypothetical protein